jgi:hypothetical protein
MFKECNSPFCENPIESESANSWRRTPKKFCSDECKTDVWALRKAANLLGALPADKRLEVLELVASGDNQREPNQDNQRAINDDNQNDASIGRRYRCEQWPRLRLASNVRFCEGLFETKDPELIELVERNELYGAHIVRLGT